MFVNYYVNLHHNFKCKFLNDYSTNLLPHNN